MRWKNTKKEIVITWLVTAKQLNCFRIVIFSIKIEICSMECLLGSLFLGMEYLKTSVEMWALFSQVNKVMFNVAFEI